MKPNSTGHWTEEFQIILCSTEVKVCETKHKENLIAWQRCKLG